MKELLGDAYPPDALPRALMFLNQISDPREIRDLDIHGGLNPNDLAVVLIETFRAGVPAWLETTRQVPPVTVQAGASI